MSLSLTLAHSANERVCFICAVRCRTTGAHVVTPAVTSVALHPLDASAARSTAEWQVANGSAVIWPTVQESRFDVAAVEGHSRHVDSGQRYIIDDKIKTAMVFVRCGTFGRLVSLRKDYNQCAEQPSKVNWEGDCIFRCTRYPELTCCRVRYIEQLLP